MPSTSGAIPDQRGNSRLLPAGIFRNGAAVRSAGFRSRRFCIYTCIFNAHVFVMSNPAIPIRAAGATQLAVGAVRTFYEPHCSNFDFVGAAVFRTAPQRTGWLEEQQNV